MHQYLIVGQGIAGSLLAMALRKQGQKCLIVDDSHQHSSSVIAAGIINPFTGQRIVLTPDFENLYSHARQTYEGLSALLGELFFEPQPIIRVLANQAEQERIQQLLKDPVCQKFIEDLNPPRSLGQGIVDPYGSVVFSSGGFCHAGRLMKALRSYFKSQDMLIEQPLGYNDLVLAKEGVVWQSEHFDQVVFCEGHRSQINPWFNELPYNHVKGEILRIEMNGADLPKGILCQSKWCIPLNDHQWLVGSNYDRDHIDQTITDDAAQEILEGLHFISNPKKVLAQSAAVRPVVIDQMPVMGCHPKHQAIAIFNGFASKGFLTVPQWSDVMSNFLLKGGSLPKNVDVGRFYRSR